jgi:hypothetical protein
MERGEADLTRREIKRMEEGSAKKRNRRNQVEQINPGETLP